MDSFCSFAFEDYSVGSGHVCLGWGYSHQCAFMCVCVCVMESVCVNSCPCADPAELQPASLAPTDPSCCLISQRKPITLKQHNTLAVSCRCLFSALYSFLTIHGCRCHVYSALPVKLHKSGADAEVSHLKYTQIFRLTHQFASFCWLTAQ